MKTVQPVQAGDLGFLERYKIENENVSLPSSNRVSLPKCLLYFKPWSGDKVFDYGGKPLLDFNGEACFAELAILRLFQQHGWDGAWIETYGGLNYLRSMPTSWKLREHAIDIPEDKDELVRRIQKDGNVNACFDVLVWKGEAVLFCEAKRISKDKLNEPQKRFIQAALECGLAPEQMLIAEWNLESHQDSKI